MEDRIEFWTESLISTIPVLFLLLLGLVYVIVAYGPSRTTGEAMCRLQEEEREADVLAEMASLRKEQMGRAC